MHWRIYEGLRIGKRNIQIDGKDIWNYRKPEDADRTYMKPEPIIIASGEPEYEVEEIINHRKRRRGKRTKIEYLIV